MALGDLTERVRVALWRLAARRVARRRTAHPTPALPIEQSVTDNFLVCLETGTRHVALRRHLRETLGMTPAEYRRRWGLPESYPMVAAVYDARRSVARRSVGGGKP